MGQGSVEVCYFGDEVARLRDGLAARKQGHVLAMVPWMAGVRGIVVERKS